MFDWLKSKKKTVKSPPVSSSLSSPSAPAVVHAASRDDLVRDAIRNAKIAQDKMGKETIDRLVRMINAGETVSVEAPTPVISPATSPADQAKKIIAHMDQSKLGHFMKFLIPDNQTKH